MNWKFAWASVLQRWARPNCLTMFSFRVVSDCFNWENLGFAESGALASSSPFVILSMATELLLTIHGHPTPTLFLLLPQGYPKRWLRGLIFVLMFYAFTCCCLFLVLDYIVLMFVQDVVKERRKFIPLEGDDETD